MESSKEVRSLRKRLAELERLQREWEKERAALEESKKDFAALFSQSNDAIFLEDTNGNILDVNKRACELLGYTHRELTKLNVADLVPPEASAFLPRQGEAATPPGEPLVTVNKHKDGTLIPVEVSGTTLEIGGKPRLLVSLRDVSKRVKVEKALRKSEERFRCLFQEMGDAVFVVATESGEILDANQAAIQQSGYAKEELIGMNILNDLSIGEPDIGHDQLVKRLAAGEAARFTQKKRKKDGTLYWEEVITVPIEYGKDKVHLSVNRDITERVEAERALQAANRKIESLHKVARRLAACDEEEEVYRVTVDAAEKILDFSLCSLDIVEENKLVVKATSSSLPPEASRESDLDEGGLAGKTYRTGETIVFGSLDEVPEATPTREEFMSGISAPIGDIGVFQVVATEANAFSEDDARLLELLLGHTAEAIRRIRLQNELKEQAIRDPLTGVYNRRHFTQTIERELERSKRYEHPISFLMIDINRFKEINDRFGHQMGDKVLQEAASLLQEQVRDVDIVVRYGGDEFLIILPETPGATDEVVERIHQAVARGNEKNNLLDFPITLSIGSVHWNPKAAVPLEEVMAEADRRMYEDKRRQEAISRDERSLVDRGDER